MVLFSLMLTGCLQRSDSMAPIITITSPTSGAVRTADNLTVRGYVFDDDGVAAIRVNGQDLLSHPLYASRRGKRLVDFGFSNVNLQEGRWSVRIEAEDTRGRITTLDYELQIDVTPPTLELNPLEPLSGNLLRVSGVARDNLMLASITVNDVQIPVGQVKERIFTVDIPRASTVTVTVKDQAGNVITRQLSP
jgi:hypothetical protein